ncbi:toxin-antitoxin system YwqK family antitoxin [Flammeovirga pectinis]|uniref:Toxin-antitoxin system YwqK family antitoxin n=1 Tax=Flammeovirga pectinis TaxID=2494373 RepID=A0A3Q9FLZ1_9BACT|nr:toxin-antitoxin system YwqK family antitoxin [Flammeovirga pectinis]
MITTFSCQQIEQEEVVNLKVATVDAKDVKFKSSKGVFYVNGQVFSGEIYWTYRNGTDTLRVKRYWKGLKEGQWTRYYPDRSIQEYRFFHKNKKEGEYVGFYPNGEMKFEYHLTHGVYEGNNRAWNKDGRLISDMNYVVGSEEGAQKVWYDNGKIKSNYVIKNGRRYGLLGTKNCINVTDSIF